MRITDSQVVQQAADSLLAIDLMNDLEAEGYNFRLQASTVPYGGGFAMGWHRIQSYRLVDESGQAYDAKTFVGALSVLSEASGLADWPGVERVVDFWIQHS